MKSKLFFILLFIGLVQIQAAYAQIIVDGQNLYEIDTKYAEIIISRRVMTQEMQVMIDYGQYIDYHREFQQRIETPKGENIQFRSVVQILNLMDYNGWEFLQTCPAHTNNFERLHYLFRRKEDGKH
jgi:hypothetical protein